MQQCPTINNNSIINNPITKINTIKNKQQYRNNLFESNPPLPPRGGYCDGNTEEMQLQIGKVIFYAA
jgi:hypothetical protein